MELPASYAEREAEFISFILLAPLIQVKLLFKRATASQINALSEIAFNLLHDSELKPELLKDLKQYASLIRKIGDRKKTLTFRRLAVERSPTTVIKILQLVESILP